MSSGGAEIINSSWMTFSSRLWASFWFSILLDPDFDLALLFETDNATAARPLEVAGIGLRKARKEPKDKTNAFEARRGAQEGLNVA